MGLKALISTCVLNGVLIAGGYVYDEDILAWYSTGKHPR